MIRSLLRLAGSLPPGLKATQEPCANEYDPEQTQERCNQRLMHLIHCPAVHHQDQFGDWTRTPVQSVEEETPPTGAQSGKVVILIRLPLPQADKAKVKNNNSRQKQCCSGVDYQKPA